MILRQSKDVEDCVYAIFKPPHSKRLIRIESHKHKWHGDNKASCGMLIVDNADLGKVDFRDERTLKKAYETFTKKHLNHKQIFSDEAEFVSTLKEYGEHLGHHEIREESADGYIIERDYYQEDENVRKLLHRPDLFDFIVKVANSVIRCEPNNVPAGLLTLLSAWTDKPASVDVRGASSSGKTWLWMKLLSLMPEEKRVKLVGSSAKSLFFDWKEEDERGRRIVDVQGKMIVVLESKGVKGLLEHIKPLKSHDSYEVEYRTSFEAADGRKTVTYVIRGYPVVVDLNIDPKRKHESETRAFLMSPSLSKAKTEEALELVSREASDPLLYGEDNPDVILIRKALSSLRPYHVINPFLHKLEELFPKSSMAEARHLRRLNSVICARTILYQYQRLKLTFLDGTECLLATAEDNLEGLKAVAHLMPQTFSGIPEQSSRFWTHYVLALGDDWFKVIDVIKTADKNKDTSFDSKHKARSQLAFFEEKGWLRKKVGKIGEPHRFRIDPEFVGVTADLRCFDGVLTVEDMEIRQEFWDTVKRLEKITSGSKELWRRKRGVAYSADDLTVVRGLCLENRETTVKEPSTDREVPSQRYDEHGWLKPDEFDLLEAKRRKEEEEWLLGHEARVAKKAKAKEGSR